MLTMYMLDTIFKIFKQNNNDKNNKNSCYMTWWPLMLNKDLLKTRQNNPLHTLITRVSFSSFPKIRVVKEYGIQQRR